MRESVGMCVSLEPPDLPHFPQLHRDVHLYGRPYIAEVCGSRDRLRKAPAPRLLESRRLGGDPQNLLGPLDVTA